MTAWRFDQGRLDYFQFDDVKKIACALAAMDGIKKPRAQDPDLILSGLKKFSGLPFSRPTSHTVWRNYGRVFKCLLLVADVKGKIVATDLCKKISADPTKIDCDSYLSHFARNFYYSSPIFEGYDPSGTQLFPAVAIIKFLVSQYLTNGIDHVSVTDVAQYLIANNVTGDEPLADYAKLTKRSASADVRQLRELIEFISQFSFLSWTGSNLQLTVTDEKKLRELVLSLQPIHNVRKVDRAEEILQMGSGFGAIAVGGADVVPGFEELDEEFTEGKKTRVNHLRVERSAGLKKKYFQHTKHPEVCNMCGMNTHSKYPWAVHVIEIHHLLPLASPIRSGTSSLSDLAGLCPTCHRAVHRYYGVWLKTNNRNDFLDDKEAIDVYEKAKKHIK